MTTTREPVFRLNKETHKYEVRIYQLLEVDKERFDQLLLEYVKTNLPQADLMDPATWAEATSQIGKITYWMNRSHLCTITTLVEDTSLVVAPVQQQAKSNRAAPGTAKLSYSEIEADLRGRARGIPPYLWEKQLHTPILKEVRSDTIEYKRNSYIRSDEKKALALLRQEWEAGTYYIWPEAKAQQEAYEREQEALVTQKIEVVAEVVNGSRIR